MNEHTSKCLTMLFPQFESRSREGPLSLPDHVEFFVYNYSAIPLLYIYIYICVCVCVCVFFFHIHTVRLDIIKDFYSPTDAPVNCLKKQY